MTESITSNNLCVEPDEFVQNKSIWVVQLSDKTTVYQDDDRPGVEEPSAWTRLKRYCAANNVYVERFWLQFRSNVIEILPQFADGYYFSKTAMKVWGEEETRHGYIVAVIWNERLVGYNVSVPDFTIQELINRSVDWDSDFLIPKQLTGPSPGPIMN